jgi:hypothetical protein
MKPAETYISVQCVEDVHVARSDKFSGRTRYTDQHHTISPFVLAIQQQSKTWLAIHSDQRDNALFWKYVTPSKTLRLVGATEPCASPDLLTNATLVHQKAISYDKR